MLFKFCSSCFRNYIIHILLPKNLLKMINDDAYMSEFVSYNVLDKDYIKSKEQKLIPNQP